MDDELIQYIDAEIERYEGEMKGEVPRSPHYNRCRMAINALKDVKEKLKKRKPVKPAKLH